MKSFRESLEHGANYSCKNTLAWQCANWDGRAFWLSSINGKPRVTAFSREPQRVLPVAKTGSQRPDPMSLSAAEIADLDARIARLPIVVHSVLRGRLVGHVPFAVLSSVDPTTPSAFLLLGGSVSQLVAIDAVTSARHRLGEGKLEARLWDADADGNEDIVLRLVPTKGGTWLFIATVNWLESPALLLHQSNEPLTFWAHGTRTMDEAIIAMSAVPRRGVTAAQALALLRASKTMKGFEKHATADVRIFEMEGHWNTGGQVVRRANERSRDQVGPQDLDFPDGTFIAMLGCCLEFHCMKDFPHCYCHSRSCGVADQFWFAWEKGKLKLAGAGSPAD
jgi:hypothetical protein